MYEEFFVALQKRDEAEASVVVPFDQRSVGFHCVVGFAWRN
ncbi:hypothetical protein [Povalibacter sp.]